MLYFVQQRPQQLHEDGNKEIFRWEHRPPESRLPAWATLDRYRFARMIPAFLLAALFAILSFGSVIQHKSTKGNVFSEPLKFTSEGTFQISIFEDLHFGESTYFTSLNVSMLKVLTVHTDAWDQWGPQQDIWSIYVENQVLTAESPQLVVLNGDLITGENTFLENSTHYIDEIVGPFVKRGLSWASTYGNHDSAFNLSRDGILARERLYPNARTTQMVFSSTAGVTNYYLPVYPSDGSNEPSMLLWFFDSRGGWRFQQLNASGDMIGEQDWVDQTVVDWFKQTSSDLSQRYGRIIPSLAFVHIPTNASQALQTEAGVNPHYQPGINDDYVLAQQAQGWCADGSNEPHCIYGGQDVPFMEAITSTPGMIALFSGHDHGDTWCYKWNSLLPGMTVEGNGINLCFGQHSGYGGYGTWTRGSRQVLFTESMLSNFEVETWIRLETGEVVGSVTLNSTYNRDWYPATKDTHTQCPTCVW